jgi:hypothetical protein
VHGEWCLRREAALDPAAVASSSPNLLGGFLRRSSNRQNRVRSYDRLRGEGRGLQLDCRHGAPDACAFGGFIARERATNLFVVSPCGAGFIENALRALPASQPVYTDKPCLI